mgnify:FL=1
MLIGRDVLIMKIYKRILMTYIDKYQRLDLDMLTEEMRLTETQIVDIVYSLIEEGFIYMKDHKYKISEKGKNFVFPTWNEWSFCSDKERGNTEKNFTWDYLYIPKNMI